MSWASSAGDVAESLLTLNGERERTCTTFGRVIVWPGGTRPRLTIDGVTETELWTLATTEIGIACAGKSLVTSVIWSLRKPLARPGWRVAVICHWIRPSTVRLTSLATALTLSVWVFI